MSAFRPQIFFYVVEMTSVAVADAVMSALMALNRGATVRIDLPARRVEIELGDSKPAEFRKAIGDAGYSSIRQWPSKRTCL